MPATLDDVARIALELPEVAEIPPEPPLLAVRTADLEEKEAVLAEGRKGFFTIPHFDGYAAVLIHLKTVGKRPLREAIIDGWSAMAPPTLAAK